MNLQKIERYLRLNLLGPGLCLIKNIYRAAVSQKLRNTALCTRGIFTISIQLSRLFSTLDAVELCVS